MIKAKPGPPEPPSPTEIEFMGWTSLELGNLFDEAMKRWNMPAAEIADELFTCLVGSCHGRDVDPALIKNPELADALRKRRREHEEMSLMFKLMIKLRKVH
jgi:hypothetical protein